MRLEWSFADNAWRALLDCEKCRNRECARFESIRIGPDRLTQDEIKALLDTSFRRLPRRECDARAAA